MPKRLLQTVLTAVILAILVTPLVLAPAPQDTEKVDIFAQTYARAQKIDRILGFTTATLPCTRIVTDPQQMPITKGSKMCFIWNYHGRDEFMKMTGAGLITAQNENGVIVYYAYTYRNNAEYTDFTKAITVSRYPGGYETEITGSEFQILVRFGYATELQDKNGEIIEAEQPLDLQGQIFLVPTEWDPQGMGTIGVFDQNHLDMLVSVAKANNYHISTSTGMFFSGDCVHGVCQVPEGFRVFVTNTQREVIYDGICAMYPRYFEICTN